MTIKLSALVIAHNEERHLPECLKALTFADEIVVVLDDCHDHSYRIASKFTKRLIEGSWDIEGERRNLGIENCDGEWILEIDADERVGKDLQEEIMSAIEREEQADYFYIPFDNYIAGNLVKEGWGCYWGVRSAPRLFKKGNKQWNDASIHPSYEVLGAEGRLHSSIIHYVDDGISDMIQRFDRYTDAHAKDLINRDNIGGFWNNFRRIFSRFLKCYVVRKGYKEGAYGFLNAICAGMYPLISYLKARELLAQHADK